MVMMITFLLHVGKLCISVLLLGFTSFCLCVDARQHTLQGEFLRNYRSFTQNTAVDTHTFFFPHTYFLVLPSKLNIGWPIHPLINIQGTHTLFLWFSWLFVQMSEHYWAPQSNVSNETSTAKTFQRTISAQVRVSVLGDGVKLVFFSCLIFQLVALWEFYYIPVHLRPFFPDKPGSCVFICKN